jgi:hypothetical protein
MAPIAAKQLEVFAIPPARCLAGRRPALPPDWPPRQAPANGGQVVAVRIGYGEQPIVEEEAVSGADLSDE